MRIRVMDPTMSPSDPPVALTVFKPRIEEMPSVQAAGDIVYFDRVKVTLFGGRAQLISNNMSRWDVLHTSVLGSTEQQRHPVVAYLERWWKKQSERLTGAADGRSPAKAWVAPGPRHINGSDKYLRKVSELQGASFADMYLEVVQVGGAGIGASSSFEMQSIDAVHKQPTQRIQCLVTDYTTNPLINTDDPDAMDGRFVWLTIFEPQTINKLPAIEPDAVYWLRNVRIEYSDTHGMSLRLMPNAMYPKTISVVRVDPEDDHVLPLLARKAEYQKEMQRCRDATIAAAGDPDEPVELAEPEEEGESGLLAGSSTYGDGDRQLMVLGEPVFAKVTSIAEIMDSEKIDSCVYRVKAFVVGVHPPQPERAFVLVCDMCGNTHEHMPAAPIQCTKCSAPWALEFRMLLRLKDEEDGEEGRECVAVCQGIGEGNLDHESTWLLHDEAARNNFVDAIAPIWRAVHPAFGGKPGAMEAELLVASVVAPGAGGGSIGRTLLVSGGLGAIFFADIL
ncbi:hypothetical protein GGI23_001422 [Coemansia sp. RSA 2559]|nr:hypothetical protein GGI23_001422 [Coemansia sp. RSA 2559]KAJ2867269.1 hypothetical protein GGI22_001100 [Coemansia erecta]